MQGASGPWQLGVATRRLSEAAWPRPQLNAEPLGSGAMSQLDRGQSTRIMYIELKSDHGDSGPARIGRVSFSKTSKTIYYRGKELQRIKGGGIAGKYRDLDTGEEYWVSGVKHNHQSRHWAESGPVHIDSDERDEYLALLRGSPEERFE